MTKLVIPHKISSLIFYFAIFVSIQTTKQALTVIKQCPDKKTIGTYENVKLYTIHGKTFVDYSVRFSKEVTTTKLMTQWIITRCNGKEALDTCQHFTTIRSNDYCKMIAKKGELWSGLTDCLVPSMTCPFKKITYHGKNCSVPNENTTKFMPLSRSYWKFWVEVWDLNQKIMILCSLVEGIVV